ncbi:F-box only protein 3 [Scyliorhinus canicula]|uniref:F-box only protein 3 n=1 Tax=Scyliorhinus canicula TaxID=7830 RepID=UPI0018F52D68|nr:F-box only protein 3 [Scyliorhinus canicula]
MAARAGPGIFGLELLPTEPILLILRFLNYKDLGSCRSVCRRFYHLCSHDPLWKKHCKRHWLLSEDDKVKHNVCWMELFRQFYCDLGQYIDHYAELKQAWENLKKYLGQNCPRMITSLNVGLTEQELEAVEERIKFSLPKDYRCSLRIHNGQRLVVPGLMGSMALSSHYRSEDLLDIDTAAGGFQQRKGLMHCLPLTFCIHTGLSQYMALDEVEGRKPCEIFYHCVDQLASDPSVVDMFLTGSSFTDWFTTFVNNVTSGRYPIIRDQIFRYIHDERCVAQTGDIIISVSTSFLPELSSVHPPHYFFSYRIRIEMVKDASPDNVCQLDSRYWKITNENGDVEEVQGSGVVGEFPVLHPGTVHEYTSCTTFTTPLGYMEGYYTFHHLSRKRTTFNVAIPRFYMECLPSRASTAHQNGRSLDPSRDDMPPSDCNDRQNPNLFVNFPAALGRCPRHT